MSSTGDRDEPSPDAVASGPADPAVPAVPLPVEDTLLDPGEGPPSQWEHQPPPPPPAPADVPVHAPRTRRSRRRVLLVAGAAVLTLVLVAAGYTVVGHLVDASAHRSLTAQRELMAGLLAGCAMSDTMSDTDAIAVAQEFRTEYPDHPRTAEVTAAYARRVLARARSDFTTSPLDQVAVSGSPGGPKAVLVVYNDSPEALRLALSGGPSPLVQDIGACPACEIKSATDTNHVCEQKGPTVRLTIAPGDYDVALENPDNLDSTRSGVGRWHLDAGKQYFGCWVTVHGQ